MIIDIIKKGLENIPADAPGIILDGFPRTVEQAQALEDMMSESGKETTVLLDLQVENRELINRLLIRVKLS